MQFKKIKFSKKRGKISIEYEVVKGEGEPDEFSFSSSEKPRPEFHEALQALAGDVVEMCELPTSYLNRITVRSVSLSYAGEDKTLGATLSAAMSLEKSNVPLNLNTPHKPAEPYSGPDGDREQCLEADCVDRIGTLMEEAEKYVKGIRSQGDLFQETKKEGVTIDIG